jgi:hypothetical protein
MLLVDEVLISDLVIESSFECDLQMCKGCCCQIGDRGSPLKRTEVEEISKLKNIVGPLLSDDRRQLLEEKNFFIKDGSHIELQCIPDGCCIFSFRENEDTPLFCLLEKLWLEGKTSFRKPIFCHLFPLVVDTFYNRQCINMEERPECSDAIGNGPSVIESCKDALLRVFSEELYEKILTKVKEERKKLGYSVTINFPGT